MKLHDYEKKHLMQMRKFAPECMVLLKKNGDFPVKEVGKIALYGSGARKTIKGGTGSGDVNSRYYITVEKGLERAGFTLTTKDWLDAYDDQWKAARAEFIKSIKRQAKEQHTQAIFLGMGAVMPEPEYDLPLNGEGDTAIYVLSRISGEGNDRRPEAGDICLTETEIRDILACCRKYQHFMLVLNVGGVVDLTPVSEVENILLLSQLGAVTGDAFADVVLGKSYPSGKLTTTWSAWEDYAKIGDFGEKDDTRYKEGIYVGYRYFDSVGKEALFPFGYGLSYTDVVIGETSVSLEGTKVTVEAEVTNTGRLPGKEVVQLYVTAPWGELDKPYQELAAFVKTKELAAGEKETVTLTFLLEKIASYNEKKAAYVLEAGQYVLRLGSSSRDTEVCGVVALNQEVCVRQLTNVGGKADFTDWKPEYTWNEEIPEEVPVLNVEESAFAEVVWPQPAEISEEAKKFAEKLTDEELSSLCIGSHKEGPALMSVIGSASQSVAGAAGESSSRVSGVPAIIMADGPAGLRLNRKYTKDEKGIHPIGESLPAGMSEFLPGIARFFLNMGSNKKPKGKIYEQYCTAIPIGTALAQSWNVQLCEACGDIVGNEMERFGVHLWLAPAFNIHRSPLCGRNFEYYSEDPLISGLVGAAVCRGVEKHPGCGTTVKHFCCNNQEANRYQSNSIVSERALREIYLKGFEYCISEGKPSALMTSYNLLNGIHTSERADILKTVLREEWGFSGLVVSDWVVAGMKGKNCKYRTARAAAAVKGGNDAFMPGNSGNYKDVLTALKGKTPDIVLSRNEVEYCAAHVIEAAWKLCGKE